MKKLEKSLKEQGQVTVVSDSQIGEEVRLVLMGIGYNEITVADRASMDIKLTDDLIIVEKKGSSGNIQQKKFLLIKKRGENYLFSTVALNQFSEEKLRF